MPEEALVRVLVCIICFVFLYHDHPVWQIICYLEVDSDLVMFERTILSATDVSLFSVILFPRERLLKCSVSVYTH